MCWFLDVCGVCNGSGPSLAVVDSIYVVYDSVFAEPIGEWLVFEVGQDTIFSFECDPNLSTTVWNCGQPVNYHGYHYDTVEIGDQCWFSENLRTTLYRDSTAIPSTIPAGIWGESNDFTGGYCTYGDANCWPIVIMELGVRLQLWI